LERSQVDQQQNEKDQVDTQAALAALTQVRDAEHQQFVSVVSEHEEALVILEDTVNFLVELVAGDASLIQLASRTMSLIRTGTIIHKMHYYAPCLT